MVRDSEALKIYTKNNEEQNRKIFKNCWLKQKKAGETIFLLNNNLIARYEISLSFSWG